MTVRAQTVTILFTDLVSSTELLQRAGDERAQRIFKTHHRLLSEAVQAHGGHEVKWLGDGLMVAFDSARDAARCAIEMQQASRRPAAGERLEIRVGLHVGDAFVDESDYFGTSVVIARRLCDKAGAGQIFASDLVARLLDGRHEITFEDLGALALKGIESPVHAHEVRYEHDPLAMLAVTPFVGRDDVIAALTKKLDEACAGKGSLAMLVGEPGIGKTRTTEEFCEHARQAGVAVLRGRCYDGEWAAPFSPFMEAIREYASSASPNELTQRLGPDAGVLARIVPMLREQLPDIAEPPSIPAEGERYRLLEAAGDFFARVAAARPLVLMLDDLHWADKGTIAMLRQVARLAPQHRLLIIGAYRDIELDRTHPLADALQTLRRETNYERLVLKGLGAADVGALLNLVAEQDVPEPFVRAIGDETGGNPFFIREVMLHLVEEKKIVQEDGRWVAATAIADMRIPEGVREVIGRRLSRVSDACGRMLTVASALTAGFSWEVISTLVDLDEARLLDAVDEALGAQLIVERERGRYDFTHALIRHTLYEELSTPRRILLHRQIGEALERLYADDVEFCEHLAHHFELGDLRDKAIAYLLKSASKARTAYLNAEAQQRYEHAGILLRGYSGGSHDWRRDAQVAIYEGIGDMLVLGGNHKEGQESLQNALPFAKVAIDAARLHRKCASSFVTVRNYGEAASSFDAALTALGSAATERGSGWRYEWVQVQIERIWMHYWQGQVDEMRDIVKMARTDIEHHATQLQLVKFYQALTALGFRSERYRLSRETRGLAEAAITAMERSGDTSESAFTHFMMAFTALWMDDFVVADEHFERALEWATRAGDITVQSRVLTYRAVLHRKLRDVEAVRACVESVLPVAEAGQMLEYIGTANANLAWLALHDGDESAAEGYARTALDTWARLPIVYSFAWTARLPLLAIALARGQLAEGLDLVASTLQPPQQRLSDAMTDALETCVSIGLDDTDALREAMANAVTAAKREGYI